MLWDQQKQMMAEASRLWQINMAVSELVSQQQQRSHIPGMLFVKSIPPFGAICYLTVM